MDTGKADRWKPYVKVVREAIKKVIRERTHVKVKCHACGGSGDGLLVAKFPCPICDGRGWYMEDSDGAHVCNVCGGDLEDPDRTICNPCENNRVKKDCHVCGGTGGSPSHPCVLCDGTGYYLDWRKVLPTLTDKTKKYCYVCRGDGGDSWNPCGMCSGTGLLDIGHVEFYHGSSQRDHHTQADISVAELETLQNRLKDSEKKAQYFQEQVKKILLLKADNYPIDYALDEPISELRKRLLAALDRIDELKTKVEEQKLERGLKVINIQELKAKKTSLQADLNITEGVRAKLQDQLHKLTNCFKAIEQKTAATEATNAVLRESLRKEVDGERPELPDEEEASDTPRALDLG